MAVSIRITEKSDSVRHLSSVDGKMKSLIRSIGAIEYHCDFDSYEFLVKTIIGQMLSNKAADVITQRFEKICGGVVTPQAVSGLSVADLRGVGLSNSKAGFILQLTENVLSEKLNFSIFEAMSDAEVLKALTALNGIGPWSAKMYLIFMLCREDVLPYEDGAFLQAYSWLYPMVGQKPSEIAAACAHWCPYSSIAARYLYKALDMGMTKGLPPE
jgi:DNA-3-methyladenine glycosylase II